MEYQHLTTVSSREEADQLCARLLRQGISAHVFSCSHAVPDAEPAWMVDVYEADYWRAHNIVEEL